MENTMTMNVQNEPKSGNPEPLAGLPKVDVDMNLNNFAAEMAKRQAAAEAQNAQVQTPTSQTTPEPTITQGQPAPVVTPQPVVPEKFKTPGGEIDQAKVEKSTLSAQEALQKFLNLEKEMKRKQNEVLQAQRQQAQGYPQAYVPQPQAPVGDPFVAQLNADLAANQNNPGIVLAKLFMAAKEAAKAEALNDFGQKFQTLEERTLANQRQSELSGLISTSPELLDPQVIENVHGILEAQPWLKQSPEPYREAFRVYLGQQELLKRTGSQVNMPNPTARTGQAPPAPVQAVNRPLGNPQVQVDMGSYSAVRQSLEGLSPEQKKQAYAALGLPKY